METEWLEVIEREYEFNAIEEETDLKKKKGTTKQNERQNVGERVGERERERAM